ncbi:hypothetical protein DXK93_27225 [Achromobacter sp. K91]|uniref:hypothetical protein n=1 Tax=Achromobacter sp. K91 TaxID=2292262 RepID=UPI000E66E6D1|nr:hypothetical protein [Achromobacter sp. K91]RIJ00256.1 hypothetical protein DXK93_27225 [Achromobacter sp. K91]
MSNPIVEINGVKLELDQRTATATRIDTLRIGSKVKVLKKEYSDFRVHAGVVVGFEAFQALPTIIIAYLKNGYGENPVDFISLNAQTKDVEVMATEESELMDLQQEAILKTLDRNIESKRAELAKAEQHRELFVKHFGAMVGLAEPVSA